MRWGNVGPFERRVLSLISEEAGGGQAAGKLEVDKIDLDVARAYAEAVFRAHGRELDEQLPEFDQNFLLAKRLTAYGKTQRKDMPVINDNQVREFQQRLKDGSMDINKPLAPETNPSNPFPEGLSGETAAHWIENGFNDGSRPDDMIKVESVKVAAKDLRPIQRQIYYDKSINSTAEFGAPAARSFLNKSLMIMSNDRHIIDGHHRWSSALFIDPKLMMSGVMIDLPIAKLLPLSLAYGDAIGNRRNQ